MGRNVCISFVLTMSTYIAFKAIECFQKVLNEFDEFI